MMKRLLDIIISLSALILLAPLYAIIGYKVKKNLGSPIFFKQTRPGLQAQPFDMIKFRTMKDATDASGNLLPDSMRMTAFGKMLRSSSLDELPELWNVLKGDMSLIGPRPEQKIFVDQFEQEIPFYNYRHIVKPGITGWAQVTHGYAGDADETRVKIEHDFYYIKHISFSLDVLIVFKTIKTMLTGFGAR